MGRCKEKLPSYLLFTALLLFVVGGVIAFSALIREGNENQNNKTNQSTSSSSSYSLTKPPAAKTETKLPSFSSVPSQPPSTAPSDTASTLKPSSGAPTLRPSNLPSLLPSIIIASTKPSNEPSIPPSRSPSVKPSDTPSIQPTNEPSLRPSVDPSSIPSSAPTQSYHTVIIGAGAAGLSASYTLLHNGVPSNEIRILEASDSLGGRAKKDTTFATDSDSNAAYPLDLGPSFIQYANAIWRIVDQDGVELAVPEGTGLPTFVDYTWWDFFNDYIAPKDKDDVIDYGCKVVEVDYSGEGDAVVTKCSNGQIYTSQYLIVTVPLPILKEGDIDFKPPLPLSMTINHPGDMWQGFKIFLEFNDIDSFDDGFCITDIVPNYDGGSCMNHEGENLFWDYTPAHRDVDIGSTILAGYILGDQSLPYINLVDEEIIQSMLDLLDDKFNGRASRNFVRGFVVNWSTNENVRGTLSCWGYDKPRSRGGPGNPSGAQNVDDKVFVAGEHFPVDGENGWVDAGAFSGDDAAKQIIKLSYDVEVTNRFWTRVRRDLGR